MTVPVLGLFIVTGGVLLRLSPMNLACANFQRASATLMGFHGGDSPSLKGRVERKEVAVTWKVLLTSFIDSHLIGSVLGLIDSISMRGGNPGAVVESLGRNLRGFFLVYLMGCSRLDTKLANKRKSKRISGNVARAMTLPTCRRFKISCTGIRTRCSLTGGSW
ncbi:hypothetical protein HOY80DRAFT_961557 [Tuber brumale]|nr:hypothetical protein HOY80DRAFT_961557 [Tuber brumale]